MNKQNLKNNFEECIGNTPLIKLKIASEISGCNIYGKCEFLNPGGSVKDRAAYQIIKDALKNKEIQSGGTIVEGTAGNTGIGLCLVGNSLSLQSTIVIPRTQSKEKKICLNSVEQNLLRLTLSIFKPWNYIRVSEKISKEISNPNGVFWANQFDNLSNKKAHYLSTGPEIYDSFRYWMDLYVQLVLVEL